MKLNDDGNKGGKFGRHSLVTPIDWKPEPSCGLAVRLVGCRHSLVTPIDWKRRSCGNADPLALKRSRHSLVTPIDWKQVLQFARSRDCLLVAILW